MIRDEEIKRLTKYAQGLNVSVEFRQEKSSDDAEWCIDGSKITIFGCARKPKISIILSLIHETAHQMAHIDLNGREIDKGLDEALDDEDEAKTSRRKLYDWELEGTKYWHDIYKFTDCQFGLDKLNIAKEFDLWQYEVYLDTGRFPSRVAQRDKHRELKQKYRKEVE